jgi:hypothetical protein
MWFRSSSRASPVLDQLTKASRSLELCRAPGIARRTDSNPGQIFWTQDGPDNAGRGRIFRADVEIPAGENRGYSVRHRSVLRRAAERRSTSNSTRHILYQTDRGDPPRATRRAEPPSTKSRPSLEIVVTISWKGSGSRKCRGIGCLSPTSPAQSIPDVAKTSQPKPAGRVG